MSINRRSIAAGLTIGVLAAGAGGAIAATTSGARTTSTSSTTTSRAPGGSDRYGYGWGGGGTVWRAPAATVGWGARHGDPASPMRIGGW
jgi:hypothetical protein